MTLDQPPSHHTGFVNIRRFQAWVAFALVVGSALIGSLVASFGVGSKYAESIAEVSRTTAEANAKVESLDARTTARIDGQAEAAKSLSKGIEQNANSLIELARLINKIQLESTKEYVTKAELNALESRLLRSIDRRSVTQ